MEYTLYRGGCRTGDASQPVIFTARVYETERQAVSAIRRAAKYCGYRPSRLQLFVVPIMRDLEPEQVDELAGELTAERWLELARPVEQSGEVMS